MTPITPDHLFNYTHIVHILSEIARLKVEIFYGDTMLTSWDVSGWIATGSILRFRLRSLLPWTRLRHPEAERGRT